jgi:hypothetical protein
LVQFARNISISETLSGLQNDPGTLRFLLSRRVTGNQFL